MKALLLATLITTNVFAATGNSSGGGGNAIVTKKGEVILLELALSNDLKNAQTKEQIQNIFPTKVMKLGHETKNFFHCSQQILKKFENYQAFSLLNNIDEEISPLLVNFNLKNLENSEQLKIPYGAEQSLSANKERQVVVASYVKGRLWISKPLYEKMNKRNQCALQIHESLRHLNYLNLNAKLTTQQIENLTRFFMNTVSEALVQKDLNHLAKIQMKSDTSSDDYFKLADQYLKEHEAYSKVILDLNNNLSQEERLALYQEASVILKKAYEAQGKALKKMGEETRMIVDDLDVNAQIIEDVITNSIGPWNTKTFKRTL